MEYNQSRQTGRAMVALRKAIKQHGICRDGALVDHTSPEATQKAEALYVTALTDISPAIPPDFGTLLQLRDMLRIDKQRAEELESDALSPKGGAFSI